jgi:hypothetical protein
MEKTMKMGRFAPLTQDEMFAVEGGACSFFEIQIEYYFAEALKWGGQDSEMGKMYIKMALDTIQASYKYSPNIGAGLPRC